MQLAQLHQGVDAQYLADLAKEMGLLVGYQGNVQVVYVDNVVPIKKEKEDGDS